MKKLFVLAAFAALQACSYSKKPADSPAAQPPAADGNATTTVLATPENPDTARSSGTVGTDSSWGSPGYGSGASATKGAGAAPTNTRDTYSAGTTTPAPDATPAPAPVPVEGASGTAPGRPDADNTRVNKGDSGSSALTPMDQGGAASDRKITQMIRKAVVGDHSLSFTAKNVKIITQGGKVTLRGAVKTDQERASIEAAARKYAADGQVDNQIEVKKLSRKRE